MRVPEPVLEAVEQALGALLEQDPEARARLARWHGRVIAIALRDTGLTFHFVPDAGGRLQVLGRVEGEPDALIEGGLLDLIRAGDREEGLDTLFSGRVRIHGDTELAHGFSRVLGGLGADWEALLAPLLGGVAAHELARGLRRAGDTGRRLGGRLALDLSEYLTEEARLLPHREEIEDWTRAVEDLRDDAERLAARIALLERARSDPA